MVDDVLAPRVAKSSAAMVLTKRGMFLEERF